MCQGGLIQRILLKETVKGIGKKKMVLSGARIVHLGPPRWLLIFGKLPSAEKGNKVCKERVGVGHGKDANEYKKKINGRGLVERT